VNGSRIRTWVMFNVARQMHKQGLSAPSSIFTARCYAPAVLAMALCPSLCLSVTSRFSTKAAKRRIT